MKASRLLVQVSASNEMLLRAQLLLRISAFQFSDLEQMQDNDLRRQAQEHAQKLEKSQWSLNGAIEQREMKLRKNHSFAMFESRLRDGRRQVLKAWGSKCSCAPGRTRT